LGAAISGKEPGDGGLEGIGFKVKVWGIWFSITTFDEDSPAACPSASLDIAPPITDHETSAEINTPVPSRCKKHPRLRLAAIAGIRIVVIADPNIIKQNAAAQEVIDFFDCPAFQTSSGNLRLVRDNDQQEAMTAHPFARFWNPRWDLDLVESRG